MDICELLGRAVSRNSCQCEGPGLAGVGRAGVGEAVGGPSPRALAEQVRPHAEPGRGLAAVTHLGARRQVSLGALGSAGHRLAGHRVRPSSASAPGGREGRAGGERPRPTENRIRRGFPRPPAHQEGGWGGALC